MPATLIEDPLGIACTFSDGRTLALTLEGHDRCRRLARDLLVGLVNLVHPHGRVDSPGTVWHYWVATRHMLSWMAERGFAGGAATLSRARLAEYWLAAARHHESGTRAMLARVDDLAGLLKPDVRELVDGRRFTANPKRTPLSPYSESEWQRLVETCRSVVRDAFARHRKALAAAAAGHDPRVAGWSPQNVAWYLLRCGPTPQPAFGQYMGAVSQSTVSTRCQLPTVRADLFPTVDVVLAYRLLFGAYSGIVPDGIAALGLADADWAGDATVLLHYIKRRTAAESINLPAKAVRLLEQWLEHSGPLRRFATAEVAEGLWIRSAPPLLRPGAGPFSRATIHAFVRRHKLTDDGGQPLSLHLHRIRVTWHSHRDRRAWHGSARATIDPNHSPAVEGDHYLSAATPTQRRAVEEIIEQAQGDLLRRTHPPTVLGQDDTAALVRDYPQLISQLKLDKGVIAQLVGGHRDVFVAACADQLAGLHGPKGAPCPARPWVCLLCPLAVFAPRHAVNLLRLKAFFARQWRQMPREHFMAVFGPYAGRIDEVLELLGRHDSTLLARAASEVDDTDEQIPLRPEERTG
jgi:hypothetical protein